MISIFSRPSDVATFRLRWLGYDRAEVDAFLRQTQADRQRLQEDLAQLEAVSASHGEERRREFDRLADLRIEVASCLETSLAALRVATERLSSMPTSTPSPPLVREALRPAAAGGSARAKWQNSRGTRPGVVPAGLPLQLMWGARRRVLVAAGSLAVLILAVVKYPYEPRASEKPSAGVAQAGRDASRPGPTSAPAGSPTPSIQQVDGVVLTVTARSTCWIGTNLDGGQRLERVLKPGETIMLRADREVVLRTGDAAALSVLINNRPAKPLGATGQVVTARITHANYLSFLSDE